MKKSEKEIKYCLFLFFVQGRMGERNWKERVVEKKPNIRGERGEMKRL
jgi:hypothetical protein